MQTVKQWLEEWKTIKDPMKQKKYLDETPQDLKNLPEIDAVDQWWQVRYFYADKKQTRMGDKFIWLYLAMHEQTKNSIGIKEFLRVYRELFESENSKKLIEKYPEELYNQLYNAASIYVETIGEPPKFLGLIEQKDKDPAVRVRRVARQVVIEHVQTIWKVKGDILQAGTIIAALYNAAIDNYSGMREQLHVVIEECKDKQFKDWVKQFEI